MFGRRMLLWSAAAALIATTAACSGESTEIPTQPTDPPPQGPETLQITDLVVGEGAEATTGATVVIHFTIWHFDPEGADLKGDGITTTVGGQPNPFTIGSTSEIQGLSLGLTGMKVGGQRRVVIPPNLAYGANGNSSLGIVPNEWTVWEFQLLSTTV